MTTSPAAPTAADGSMSPVRPLFGGLGIAVGVLTIVLGLLVLFLPRATLLLVAVLFGLELIVLGVLRIVVGARAPKQAGALRVLLVVLGVLTVLAGIFCLIHPGASLLVLAIFLAAGWIADGIAAFAHAAGSGRSGGQRFLHVLTGIVSVVAGLVVAIFPGSSLVLLAQVAGVALLVLGVVQLATAIAARRAA